MRHPANLHADFLFRKAHATEKQHLDKNPVYELQIRLGRVKCVPTFSAQRQFCESPNSLHGEQRLQTLTWNDMHERIAPRSGLQDYAITLSRSPTHPHKYKTAFIGPAWWSQHGMRWEIFFGGGGNETFVGEIFL